MASSTGEVTLSHWHQISWPCLVCFCYFLWLSSNVNEFSSIPTVGTPPNNPILLEGFFPERVEDACSHQIFLCFLRVCFEIQERAKLSPFRESFSWKKKNPHHHLNTLAFSLNYNLLPTWNHAKFGGKTPLLNFAKSQWVGMSVCGHGKMLSNLEPEPKEYQWFHRWIVNSVDSSNNMFKHSQFQLGRKYMFPNIPKWSFPYPVKWRLGSHISHHPPIRRGAAGATSPGKESPRWSESWVFLSSPNQRGGYSSKSSISISHTPVNPQALDTANQLWTSLLVIFGSSWAKRPNEKRLVQLVRTQGHDFQVEMMQACLHPQMFSYTYSRSTCVCPHKHKKRRKACPYFKETNPIVNPMENVANQAHISIFTRTIPVKQKKTSWDFNSSRVFLLLKVIVLPFELDKYLGTTPDTPDTQVPELRRFRGCFCLKLFDSKNSRIANSWFSHNFQAPGTIHFYSYWILSHFPPTERRIPSSYLLALGSEYILLCHVAIVAISQLPHLRFLWSFTWPELPISRISEIRNRFRSCETMMSDAGGGGNTKITLNQPTNLRRDHSFKNHPKSYGKSATTSMLFFGYHQNLF